MKPIFTKKHYGLLVMTGLLFTSIRGTAQFGNSLTFIKEHSQYVSVPNSASLNLGATATIEAWVNYNGTNSTIVDKGDYDYLFQVGANSNVNKLGFYNKTTGWVYATGTVPQNTRTHVACSLSGGTMTFYINGVASGSSPMSLMQDNQPMNIGRQQPTACQCNFFNGAMDELRIWNVARTASQIQSNLYDTIPRNSSGLVAYYRFDETTGNTAADISPNANNGTLQNSPMWGTGILQYTTPGTYTYTVPAGVVFITAQCWGAGGNSSVACGSSQTSASGGAFSQSKRIPVVPGQTITINVGAASTTESGTGAESNIMFGAVKKLGANGGSKSAGGTAASSATFPDLDFSYRGGNKGGNITNSVTGEIYFGGGGASASPAGNGGDGNFSSAGATSGAVGGNGGNGGIRNSSCQITAAPTNGGFGAGGGAPFGNGLGFGGAGRVYLYPAFVYNKDSIRLSHTVPYPSEMPDTIRTIGTNNENGVVYEWQSSTDGTNWGIASGNVTTGNYPIPATTTPSDIIYYRRMNSALNYRSNTVFIKTFTLANNGLDGIIRGSVNSLNGSPVPDITITAKKNIALLGSPVTKTYTTMTDANGNYTIPNIFYGDYLNGDPSSVPFTVTASRPNHRITPPNIVSLQKGQLSNQINVNFRDSTVYAVSGVITQTCTGCEPGFTKDSINDVKVSAVATASFTYTGGNGFGKYGVAITNPGSYVISPGYSNHKFAPVDTLITISNSDLDNVNFRDTSTRTISGVFKAGCNELVGTANLEFTDTVAGINGTKFKRLVTTGADGSYSVRLPARRYKMRVLNFTPNTAGSDIPVGDLLIFFNITLRDTSIVKNDSAFTKIIDLDSAGKVLNLIYHRPPVVQIVNLPDTSCGPYTVMRQGISKVFRVNIYEGNAGHGCLLPPDSTQLRLISNVQGDVINDTINLMHKYAADTITLYPGYPNIIRPFYKYFSLTYKDKYQRTAAPINKNVVVLGIKTDPGTFATVSPQVPLLILHDPPGDESYSSWESNKSRETAIRFSAAQSISTKSFVQAKIGIDITTGLFVSTESRVWGQINSSLSVSGRVVEGNEAIIKTTNTNIYSTSGNNTIVGPEGDVYIGAALNLLYAVGHEVKYKSACTLDTATQIVVGESGFKTTYTYTEGFITGNEIPRLQTLAAAAPTPAKRDSMLNQVKVWQQVVANNAKNKANAKFVENISFNGSNMQEHYSTSSSTKSNTIEFNIEVNTEIATELGFEIAGSGASGGATIGFKMEIGQSTTNTTVEETKTGYKIADSDPGDYYTVDVKADPVYNTPVFSLIAGAASCPPEPPAQRRDAAQLVIINPIRTNIPANGEALYSFQVGNVSESNETRTYYLAFDNGGSSNPDGAIVTIGGAPTSDAGVRLSDIAYGGAALQTISVRKNSGNVFSYENLRFYVTDGCGAGAGSSNIIASATLSAFFVNPCSNITLASPGDNWLINSGNNNSLPVKFDGYTLANLQYITLEHQLVGASSWITDTIVYQALLPADSSAVTWNVTNIPDGKYSIRMKLVCASGTVYSSRVTGLIDRKAPIIFGTPEPTDGNYVAGDVIGYSYTENIDNSNLNNGQVELRRMSNNTVIPVQVSGYQNKLVVVPTNSITGFTGESMRLIVKNISDVYGNVKTTPDTSYFTVGTTIAGTGPTAINFAGIRTSMKENSGDSMDIRFTLSAPAANNTSVNFAITGTAGYGSDYTVRLPFGAPVSDYFNGSKGAITIPQGSMQAILWIKPIGDYLREPDETITISLVEGGDYTLGSIISKTDTIKNDDHSKPVIIVNGPATLCAGQTLTLSTNPTIDGESVYTYYWSDGTSNPTLTVSTAGRYSLIVYTADVVAGYSDTVTVTTSTMPPPNLGPDVTLYKSCFGETTNLLTVFNTTGLSSTWNTVNTAMALPGSYRLIAANSAGCTDTAFATVILDVATWTGAVSSDWNTAGNWNVGHVPTVLTHVIIPGGTPVCNVSAANAVAASLQIRPGANVKATNSMSVMVNGKCLTLPPN